MGFIASCGQCLLVLLNVLFVIISVAVVAIGVVLRFFPGTLMQFLFEGLRATVPFTVPTGTNDLDIIPLVSDIGITLIILGAILFGLSFLACCGACCRWRLFLIPFCILVILLMIAIATLGGLFLTRDSPLHATIKAGLQQQVHDEYAGPHSGDVFSLAINTISYSLRCCAIGGPEDFNTKAAWTNYNDGGTNISIQASPACCTRPYIRDNRIGECTRKPFTVNRIHTQGCYKMLLDLVQEQRVWAILAVLGVLLLLLLEVVFSIVLVMDIGEKSSRPV